MFFKITKILTTKELNMINNIYLTNIM